MNEIVGQEISIHLQNVSRCLEFLFSYMDFWYNQTYKPFHIFYKNEYQVYDEMYTNK